MVRLALGQLCGNVRGLRVALVVNDAQVGGSERQALLLADELTRRGLLPSILSLAGDGPVLDMARDMRVEAAGVALRCPLCIWRFPFNLLRVLRFFRVHDPHVIVGFTSVPNLYAGWLWKLSGAKAFLWSQRDAGLFRPAWVLERIALAGASAFIANSEDGAAYLRERLRGKSDRVHVVPNAVAIPPHVACEKPVHLSGPVRVVCVANAREAKDHATLLSAWSVVQARWHDSASRPQLDLVGAFPDDSAYAREIRRMADEGGCRETVVFRDSQRVDAALLETYDIGVLSSKTEGMPNAVLEYMAAGLPVVATGLPGIRLALGASADCWMVSIGDSVSMAKALLRLLGNPVLRRECGNHNRERARSVFTVGALADRMLALACGRCV